MLFPVFSVVTKKKGVGRTNSHHPARRLANHIYPRRIGVVLLDRVLGHVGDGVTVGPAVARERRARRDVPAPAVVGGIRVDDDKLVLVGELLVRAAVVVLLGCSAAVVHAEQHGRLFGQAGGRVDEHARCALGGEAVGGDLLELGGDAGDAAGQREDVGELHFGRLSPSGHEVEVEAENTSTDLGFHCYFYPAVNVAYSRKISWRFVSRFGGHWRAWNIFILSRS
jgi:hypothetical protein